MYSCVSVLKLAASQVKTAYNGVSKQTTEETLASFTSFEILYFGKTFRKPKQHSVSHIIIAQHIPVTTQVKEQKNIT